jgi:predicted ATPase/class 3 adenylate cyclase
MAGLPTGTVTFLFTDIEGSTKLAREHPETWETARARHHAILREAIECHQGYVFQIIGDAFCVAFHTVKDGLKAALDGQRKLQIEDWAQTPIKVRMGLHTGAAENNGSDYRGYLTMARVQRVMSTAYGGQILLSNASAELIRGELPEDITLRDMGENRLKGLLNPEHLWQVVVPDLQQHFPPLQTLNSIPNNLPIQLTSFIGREKEIAEIKQALTAHHLVTLTGSGGTGKTRLCLQVAAEVMDMFPDGVWFLALSPITDPALVPTTLASLLGLRESAESRQSISEMVCSYFHSRKALLIFDNCEHLIDSCAQLVHLLLRSCTDVYVLASSREALGVEGEMSWQVPSLSSPDIKHLPATEQLSQYEAVRLFIDRARLVQPHFAVTNDNAPAVAQICSRLDGIPLAIELAAARVNVLTVDQIAKRLDDRFRLLTGGARTALPRQQTLRAMIDWSYNLLSEQEQLLFRRLAVFVGGWTLEAAEAICSGEGIDSYLILNFLSQLVKKSLVHMTEENSVSRYHRLETIRQYAREKLWEAQEVAHIRDKHLEYFLQLAEQGYEELHGSNDLVWIDKLDTEHENLRAALGWSLESSTLDPQKALELSGALQDFWDARGYTSEGYQWLRQSLAKAPDVPTKQRCRALRGAGMLCTRLTLVQEAKEYAKASLNLARDLNIPTLIVWSLLDLVLWQDDGREYFEEAVALARATGDQYALAEALASYPTMFSISVSESIRCLKEAHEIVEKLGNVRESAYVLQVYSLTELRGGRYQASESMVLEALRLNQLLKEKHNTAHCLLILGRAASHQAYYDKAKQYEEESLQIFRDLSDQGCLTLPILDMGWNAYLAGKPEVALEHLERALSRSREYHLTGITIASSIKVGYIVASIGDLRKAKDSFQEAFEMLHSQESTYQLAHGLEMVSSLPGLSFETAARMLGKANAIREQDGFVLPLSEQQLVRPLIEELRSRLGKDAFASTYGAGARLTYQQVIDEAIEALHSIT